MQLKRFGVALAVLWALSCVVGLAQELETHGPFTGITNDIGSFSVVVPIMPNTYVTGVLTECTERPLPGVTVSVWVHVMVKQPDPIWMPGFNGGGSWYYPPAPPAQAADIQLVIVCAPGYPKVRLSTFHVRTSFAPPIIGGQAVDVGTVCLRPPAPVSGVTGDDGEFTLTIALGATLSGRLTVCTVTPIPDEMFSVVPQYGGDGEIGRFRFSVSGYADTTVTEFSTSSFFGLFTAYDVGNVCFTLPVANPPEPRGCLVIVFQYYSDDNKQYNVRLWGCAERLAQDKTCDLVAIGRITREGAGSWASDAAISYFSEEGEEAEKKLRERAGSAPAIQEKLNVGKDMTWNEIHVVGLGMLWTDPNRGDEYALAVPATMVALSEGKFTLTGYDLHLQLAAVSMMDGLLLPLLAQGAKLYFHASYLGAAQDENQTDPNTSWAYAAAEHFAARCSAVYAPKGEVKFDKGADGDGKPPEGEMQEFRPEKEGAEGG